MSAGARSSDLIARQIITAETSAHLSSPDELAQALSRSFGRLEELLSTLLEPLGFGAVVSRAVFLTGSDWPWLATAAAQSGGQGFTISALAAAVEREGPEAVREGAVALLSNIIGVLSHFIGEDLAALLVRRLWTNLEVQG